MREIANGWTRERLMQPHKDKPREAEVFAAMLV